MNRSVLEKFREWVMEQQQDLVQAGLKVTFHQGEPTPKTGAYIDIDTDDVIARVNLWESIELEVEALSVKNGERILWGYHRLQYWEDAIPLISAFLDKLKPNNK